MNHKLGRKIFIAAGFLGVLTAVIRADFPFQWRGSRGWEPESAYCRLYDARRVVTLKGEAETIPVHLGPIWYVKKQPVQIQARDLIEVTGSRVPCDGKPVILAAHIQKGHEIVKFREVKGTPLWGGVERHQR